MSRGRLLARLGVTAGRLGLVVVLAAVLLGVIAYQLHGDEGLTAVVGNGPVAGAKGGISQGDALSIVQGDAAPGKPAPSAVPAGVVQAAVHTVERLPERIKVPLEEILKHDPFALPEELRPKDEKGARRVGPGPGGKAAEADLARTKQEAALATIRQQGVQMVLVAGEQGTALVGGRRVRVGDRLEGFLVTGIGPDGIVLSNFEQNAQ